jgi:hypothetical protein
LSASDQICCSGSPEKRLERWVSLLEELAPKIRQPFSRADF